MSNINEDFKWGRIDFAMSENFDKAQIDYQIVPYGYLAQDSNVPNNIYMFESYSLMKDYFTDFTKGYQ